MSLLRDIQAAAIDSDVEITVLLRKCKVLAARLRNQEFKAWVESELNGYDEREQLPEYRVFSVSSKGHFAGAFGSGLRNADIPMFTIPEGYREEMSHSYLMSSIAEIQSLVESSGGTSLHEPWPSDFVAIVGRNIYGDMNCMQAWKVISRASLVGVIDTVRNRILSFVLEIEDEAPDAGEAPPHTNPIQQEKVSQVFNTYILGSVQNVSTGSNDVAQYGGSSIIERDVDSLVSYLEEVGVSSTDIETLRTAITKDYQDSPTANDIGKETNEWITEMQGKAAKGTWEVGVDVAKNVLPAVILRFLGQ